MPYQTIGDIVVGRPYAEVTPETTLRDACRLLCIRRVGALAVVADGALVGILSEYDVILRAVCPSRAIDELRVGDVMTRELKTVQVGTSTSDVIDLMRSNRIKHLPVLEGERPVGMLSLPDMPTIDRLIVERYADIEGTEAA